LTSTLFVRVMAWSLLIAIVVMTVVPVSLRVVTGTPHNVEHALIFLITGIAFGLGYELRMTVICAAAIVFCAALELLQLVVSGRHARISDFLIDAGAASFGIALAWFARRLGEGSRTHEPGMVDTK
jgi:VanZ family protein